MIDEKRRTLLKGTLAGGLVGAAIGAGLLKPSELLAATWPEPAFKSKKVEDALKALYGTAETEASDAIHIKAPAIAENGAVVPITVSTTLPDVEAISLIAKENPFPLTSHYQLADNTLGYIACRIKMGKTSDVIAVVKSGGKLYSAKKLVKVTIGGCGG